MDAKKARMGRKINDLKKENAAGSVTIAHYEDCFRRIAEAVGVKHSFQLMALCENDDESYADALVKFVENKMSQNS